MGEGVETSEGRGVDEEEDKEQSGEDEGRDDQKEVETEPNSSRPKRNTRPPNRYHDYMMR